MRMQMLCICFTLLATTKCSDINHDDLCGLPSCNCMRHIHCDIPRENGFARECPVRTDVLKLNKNESLRNEIIQVHNTFRNKIASGELHPFPAAAKMHYLEWDELLANTAERNVRQCVLKRDKCSNTRKFSMVGQNLGEYKYPPVMEYHLRNMILALMGYWFDEHKGCNPKYITKFQRVAKPPIRQFTLMVQEDVTAFGCSGIAFLRNGFKMFLFTCNYSVNNTIGQPVYTTSSNPGDGCTKSHDTYKHLCETASYPNPETKTTPGKTPTTKKTTPTIVNVDD